MNPTPLLAAEYQGGFFMSSFGSAFGRTKSADTSFHKPFPPEADPPLADIQH
ncbi:MAG: hypothetical protein WA063_03445 [Minisyncoccia bacterium]